ncbi:MAG: hypothetical protein IJL12_00065 [Selenomonadaceae bacterium]|nr:hypothetical protein [Selenomonadaceae bacterium]MBQ7493082.1 hypothetical protein [Selenomonadaceae bacterium]
MKKFFAVAMLMETHEDQAGNRHEPWKHLSRGKLVIVENVEFGGHWRVIIGVDTMDTEIR